VIFVAKRNILAGEEVTDCYGIHHLSLTRAERLEALDRGYAFDCACTACKEDFPLLQYVKSKLTPQVAQKLGNTLNK
jgi:hypothetical protein